MRIGIISGSGSYAWPGLSEQHPRQVKTEHGTAEVTSGRIADVEVVHLSRHGNGHSRLSNQVTHKANLAALRACDVDAVISLTVCGALDPAVPVGSLIAFDDLYFPGNRLPDGSVCTWYDTAGQVDRGHWIFDSPMSGPLGAALAHAARELGIPVTEGGCYGHVDGPRFNSRTEIAALRAVGVSAVSQTAGPEVVLAGEAELPIALLGYVTDHANGVSPEPAPVEQLVALMQASSRAFVDVVAAALPGLALPPSAGSVYRFEA